ncbi:hypothetical protein [Croceicoccus sp. Ery15]|uniref:hypothetical protein n=1 Tax=Croceicoccus sp. Ery15 TaxID=1703338 RepID=UPI001E3FFF64|nr:hypothetical protein [Croceicoccus sp. Ery15]
MKLSAIAVVAGAALILAGCEMGSDPEGPNEAFLVLRADDGAIRDFYLGGYDTMSECHDILAYEIETAEQDRNSEFWTNPDFTYGGYPSDGWTRNVIVEAKCVDRKGTKLGDNPLGKSGLGQGGLGKSGLARLIHGVGYEGLAGVA